MLFSGPDGASDVDPRDFPRADFSDWDVAGELSLGRLGEVSRGSAQVRQGSGSTLSRSGTGRCWGRAGSRVAASYHVPPMSAPQGMSRSISEPAPLGPLRAFPPASSSAPTYASDLHSPFGSASELTATSSARV